jgi:hypothetical protein
MAQTLMPRGSFAVVAFADAKEQADRGGMEAWERALVERVGRQPNETWLGDDGVDNFIWYFPPSAGGEPLARKIGGVLAPTFNVNVVDLPATPVMRPA